MVDLSEFESISPYTDEEAVEALGKVAENPVITEVSQYFFPEESPDFLKKLLKSVKGIDDFQIMVMSRVPTIGTSSWILPSHSWSCTATVFL